MHLNPMLNPGSACFKGTNFLPFKMLQAFYLHLIQQTNFEHQNKLHKVPNAKNVFGNCMEFCRSLPEGPNADNGSCNESDNPRDSVRAS